MLVQEQDSASRVRFQSPDWHQRAREVFLCPRFLRQLNARIDTFEIAEQQFAQELSLRFLPEVLDACTPKRLQQLGDSSIFFCIMQFQGNTEFRELTRVSVPIAIKPGTEQRRYTFERTILRCRRTH